MKRVSQFINELKRRNVFRAGAAYLVLAWLGVQIADILLDAFTAPNWMMRAIVIGLMLGFPVTLVLAWIYEITVEGVKRTEEVLPDESITDRTGRKLDFTIIGLLSVAVAFFALDRFVWQQIEDDAATASHNYSVAVLPFYLASEQVAPFFGQLSNDLSRLLQRSDQLRLASIDAIEALPANSSVADIAAQLGVRYLVSGAVHFDGAGVSLSVSLFDNDAGNEVWTSEFEDAQLQQTTNAVAETILVEINGKELSLPPSTIDRKVYELYLSARQHSAIDQLSEEAENLFREVITLDPRFAPALAGYCSFLVFKYELLDSADDFEEAERLCHRAWTVDAHSAEVHRALGDLYRVSGQMKKARESYAAALAINSNDLKTQVSIVNTYHEEEPDLAEIQLKRIIQQHPGSPDAYKNLQLLYYFQGRYAEAVEQQKWVVRLLPDDEGANNNLSSGLILAGMFDEAKSLLLEMLEDEFRKRGTIESNLATVLFFEGDYAGAAELYRAALDREPEDSYLYRNLADAIWHLDGKESAQPIFSNAIRLAERRLNINPDDVRGLSTLMVAYGSIGDSVRFESFKNRVLEVSETNPQVQYDIAVAASRLGAMETARFHAEKAHEFGYPVALLRADPDIAASGATFD